MKKSICIETMFLKSAFEERFKLARQHGFEYVEFWTWTETATLPILMMRYHIVKRFRPWLKY